MARKVLAAERAPAGSRMRGFRHLAKGTPIDVLRQRAEDSYVEIRLAEGRDARVYLVAADAIDRATARVMSVHRAPRHRRASGGSNVPVDWKGLGQGQNETDSLPFDKESSD